MTTKVVIACPDNSVHDALVHVESLQDNGQWVRSGDPVRVKPHETAAPIYLTRTARVVIEEDLRETAQPYTA